MRAAKLRSRSGDKGSVCGEGSGPNGDWSRVFQTWGSRVCTLTLDWVQVIAWLNRLLRSFHILAY